MSRNPDAAEGAAAAAPIVSFDSVAMRYGEGPETLLDVSFALPRGSFHFLTGASGSGKTTLLKLIYLAERPSAGRIELFGRDTAAIYSRDRPEFRRRIGIVHQEFRLLDHLSAFDNAALPLRIAGRKPAAYRADVQELLNWVGLKDRFDAMPRELSGGEKQRLAIARAVIARPDIILADEPTGNVDAQVGRRILRLFLELNRIGTTVLIASHDEELVARSGKPVLHLGEGRIQAFEGVR